ncbi:MAG TPA: response regulator [Candidatus Hydrogenedentes bacterium]|nr:response regulator [Candidatus Hydrogenedentota bacterium]HOT51731.1 response regulator [Candidatus Hydrogenedentota bacterium]HOV73776.1 response regulator [Candidatus Hydrogenedentota bacterium]HPC18258.1 response regulator [Candidatus Hydrogenedentota bacterium]HRT20571.1 response regulator [Candidatus Hydrogenedentota bacterium]
MAECKTILVVDDDPDIRFFCTTVLGGAGYNVITADSGETGLEMARTENPDLIILDIIMERLDSGYRVADALAGTIPIILLSSILNESDQIFDPKDLPVAAVLSKPISPKMLRDTVSQVLNAGV